MLEGLCLSTGLESLCPPRRAGGGVGISSQTDALSNLAGINDGWMGMDGVYSLKMLLRIADKSYKQSKKRNFFFV